MMYLINMESRISDLMFDKLSEEEKKWFPKFIKLLLENKPYLLTIDEAVTKLNNGTVILNLRIFNGKVTDVLLHETKRIVFEKNANKKTCKES